MAWPCIRIPKSTVLLSVAWAKGEISNSDVCKKLETSTNIAIYRMAVALRQAVKDGLITIKLERGK